MEFKDKVLKARLALNLSQEHLAKRIGVTFATINRWEKGHSKPSILLENKFNVFCDKNGVKFEE